MKCTQDRIVHRYVSRMAGEFTPKEWETYIKQHPKADPIPVEKILFSPATYASFGSPLREKKNTDVGAFGESEVVVMGASELVGE